MSQNLIDNDIEKSQNEIDQSIVSELNVTPDMNQIIPQLIDKLTRNIYVNVCYGLFEQDKIIFSFLICTSIYKNNGMIDEMSYNMLLRGQGVYDKTHQPEYYEHKQVHDILTEQQWDLAYCM